MKDGFRGCGSSFWRGAPGGLLVRLCLASAMFLVPPLAAQQKAATGSAADAAETYYPEPESAGGWRRCLSDEDVRKLAGIDPVQLDIIHRNHRVLYGGPWALLVIRDGYIAGEWYGVPAEPGTIYDVWSCTKGAVGVAMGMLFDDSRAGRLPNKAQISLDTLAYDLIPEGKPLSDPRKQDITIRHLLSMTSGFPGEEHGRIGVQVQPGGGAFEIALGKEADRRGNSAAGLVNRPGETWTYSDQAFAHLSLISTLTARGGSPPRSPGQVEIAARSESISPTPPSRNP